MVLPIVNAGFVRIQSKANEVAGDVVTNVDYAVQIILAKQLPALFPTSRFVGEEDFVEIANPAEGVIWIADPLDGTLNFVNGIPYYGISIALIVDGMPTIAFVLDAVTGTVWDAVAGGGARRDGVAFVHDAARAATAPVSVSSGTVAFDAEASGLGLLAYLRRINPRLRILGSQALQLCYVAEGRLRIVVNRESRLWDDAAGWLVCREAAAAYALASGESLFPLTTRAAAVRGAALFSIAGDPPLVAEVAALLMSLANPRI